METAWWQPADRATKAALWEASSICAALAGVVAMLSASLVFVVYFAFPDRRSSWRQLVLMLAVCDFLHGYFYAVAGTSALAWPDAETSTSCRVHGVIGMWSGCASFLWMAALTSYIAIFLRLGEPTKALQYSVDSRVAVLLVAICFGYPTITISGILLAGVPLDEDDGPNDHYGCFIDSKFCASRLLAIYGPLWLSILVTVGCSVSIWCKLSTFINTTSRPLQHNMRSLRAKLLMIPIGFVLLRLPETVYRLLEYRTILSTGCGIATNTTQDEEKSFEDSLFGSVLSAVQAITNPSQGVLTSIIFVWSSPAYRERLWQRAPCCVTRALQARRNRDGCCDWCGGGQPELADRLIHTDRPPSDGQATSQASSRSSHSDRQHDVQGASALPLRDGARHKTDEVHSDHVLTAPGDDQDSVVPVLESRTSDGNRSSFRELAS